jgi:hypothetical protein
MMAGPSPKPQASHSAFRQLKFNCDYLILSSAIKIQYKKLIKRNYEGM